jgi:hypothetical protein
MEKNLIKIDNMDQEIKNIRIISDHGNKMIIMKDKNYIIDKNKIYSTKDGIKITIDGVNNELDKLRCINDKKDELFMELDDVIFDDNEIKDATPYIYYNDTKIFFNQRQQKLIKTEKIVSVIKYAGDGQMLCKCDDGTEIKYKPDEDFVNFKDFANTIKNRNSRNMENNYPMVKFIHDNSDIIFAKVFPNMQDTYIRVDGEIKEGKIIGNNKEKTKIIFKYDDEELEVMLEDLGNKEFIKSKAIGSFKKKKENKKPLSNVINIERNVNEKLSYLDVASSKESNFKNEKIISNTLEDEIKLNEEDKTIEELKLENQKLKEKHIKLVKLLLENNINFDIIL